MRKWIMCLPLLLGVTLRAEPISIVAAENFYGDIAKQMGGPYVKVLSIMSNPNQDPHLFSSSASTAKAIADADLIIYNGLNYDPWMTKLIQVDEQRKNETIIIVADLLGKKEGDNPHIWYDPSTMPTYAQELVKKLTLLDPEHKNYFEQQFSKFQEGFKPLSEMIMNLKKLYKGTPVIATESVFNYMADALGFVMYGIRFQLNIMNDTEPRASDIQDFEEKLKQHKVAVLFYNDQVVNPMTERMQNLAKKVDIPIVGVSEMQPPKQPYIQWVMEELKLLDQALSKNIGAPLERS